MLHRIVVDIVEVPLPVVLILNQVLPESALPNGMFLTLAVRVVPTKSGKPEASISIVNRDLTNRHRVLKSSSFEGNFQRQCR